MRLQSIVQAVLAIGLAACGGVSKPSDQPDAGMPPMPDAPGSASCMAGAACQIDGAPGLCAATGLCGDCVDTADDAKCAAAYGAGTMCIQGGCVPATCHSSADCPGQQCIDNQCVGCNSDTDCASGEICNPSGSCVSAGSVCSGQPISSACGAGDLCCNVGGPETCIAAQCCVAADCTAITGAGSSCQAGTCVPQGSTCTAPTSATYYVDPAYNGPSTGTAACPFKTLHGAFNAVRNDAFTGDSDVILKGGPINATSEGGAQYFPMTLPSSVYVRTQNGVAPVVIVAPANTTAFEAPYGAQAAAASNWAARVSNIEIKQATLGTGGTAFHITGGSVAKPIHLDHLEIHNFFHGINVAPGGAADLDWGMNSHDNQSAGLYIGGGRVDMAVGASADARSHFDHNTFGIYVTNDASSVLTIAAAEPTGGPFAGLKMVTASNNSTSGIHLSSPNAANSLSHVGVESSGGSGLTLYGGAKIKVRNLRIQSSGANGIKIADDGSATTLNGIDLGGTGDLGHNQITGSTDSHICVGTTPDGSFLDALGNTFGSVDCTVSTTTGMVRSFLTCEGHGGGVNDPAPTVRESVAYCSLMFH